MTQDFDGDEQSGNSSGGIRPDELARYVIDCAKKHWIAGVVIFLLISVPGVLIARMLPREYATRARILVVSKEGIRARVTGAGEGERVVDELNAVRDKLLRLDNLRAIADDVGLERTWQARRPPLLALKDRLRGNFATLTKEERARMFMGAVESKLIIEADSQAGILTIEGRWSDPETAFELVEAAKKRFLHERLRNDVQVFEEVIAILEQQKGAAGRELDTSLARVENAGWRPNTPGNPPPSAGRAPSADFASRLVDRVKETSTPDPESLLKLDALRRQVRELQEPWQRRIADLKLQLSDLNSHYGPKHPLVVNQENRVREASVPPAGLDALRAEEAELVAMVEEASRPKERIVIRNLPREEDRDDATEASPQARVRVESSAALSTEQAKLVQAVNKYNALSERIDKTRVELNIASTAFKYRFNVVEQPEIPRGPLKPKMPLFVALGSLVFGALAAVLLGPMRELISGKFSAPWQAKTLGIPLLGELCFPEDEAS